MRLGPEACGNWESFHLHDTVGAIVLHYHPASSSRDAAKPIGEKELASKSSNVRVIAGNAAATAD